MVVAVLTALISVGISSYAKGVGPDWWCIPKSSLARDASGKLVCLDVDQMMKRALRRVPPKVPPSARLEGCVEVEVMVASDGAAKCSRALPGSHPLLKRAATEAAQQWMFEPWLIDGKPSAVMGRILLPFSSSGTMPSCAAGYWK